MKKLLIAVGILILIIVIVLAVGVSNLGPIIKKAVNTYGPQITKTHVHVDDVGLSLLSGEAKLKGFVLGNPEGFTSPEAMSVGSMYVNLDEKSLTGDTIVIDAVEVVKPVIFYEKVRRTDNFQTIINNINTGNSGKSAPAEVEAEGGGKKIAIRDFVLREGTVHLALSGRKGTRAVSANLPEIHLTDLGGENGIEPAEAAEQILAAIYKKVGSPMVTEALEKGSKALNEAVEGARDDLQKEVKDAQDHIEEEIDKAREKTKKLFGQ